ncbi:MAG TPA: hypothetical protein GXX28_01070 [Firmicutes bacterium]|nr:hypothetical protein [Bacillota bacterium]
MGKSVLAAVLLVLALGLVGCSSNPVAVGIPPMPSSPAAPSVIIVSASSAKTYLYQETVTMNLQNNGGAGYFKVRAYCLSRTPGQPMEMTDESEAFDVIAGWKDTMTWVAYTGYGGTETSIKRLVVLCRAPSSTEWVETSTYNL